MNTCIYVYKDIYKLFMVHIYTLLYIGIGSKATVKSNHHLTELLKMTFRKSDPELICLYLGPEGKIRQYRVSKRKEFVESLQKNMQRFK
jgi:hypothetical protein